LYPTQIQNYNNSRILKITFLGTGSSQGIPVIACTCKVCLSNDIRDVRLRSSVLIETAGKNIVIDCGPDFRQQALYAKLTHIDGILLTHSHKDHTAGLDEVRAFNFFMQQPVHLYLSKQTSNDLHHDFAYAYQEPKYPGSPEIVDHIISNKPFHVHDIEVVPVLGAHFNMPVFGFRIGDFSYVTDMNEISNKEIKKLENSKVLVISALRKKKHYSHFSLSEAVKIIKKTGCDQGFITHISHQMGLHQEIEKELPSNISLAFDGLSVEIL